jgi:hypothetical protein
MSGTMLRRLQAAFPHYARTVLRPIHTAWLTSQERESSRYGVTAPITEDQSEAFDGARYQPEVDGESIAAVLRSMDAKHGETGGLKQGFGRYDRAGVHLINDEVVEHVKKSGFAGRIHSSAKAILDSMRRNGIVSRRRVSTAGGKSWYALEAVQRSEDAED